ncbi:MAG: GNAT family N-acetyltransferase [Clostridiales bacterium]|nr:GNAT family N-acetyltransferase [Clostridiales bacterium]
MKEIDYSKYYWKNDFISLRQPVESDWESQLQNMYDSNNRFFFNGEIDMPVDVDKYKKEFAESIESNGKDYMCFAIENSEGKHVGIANLFGIDEKNGVFGPIGIQINVEDRRKGYAEAAARMLAVFMFNEKRMHKWNSGYMEDNTASANLHKKLGFEIEGIRKDIAFHDGKYWNEVICGITEKQFFER